MNRFFIDKDNIRENIAIVEGEDVKHIKNVLRLNIGDKIELCDGSNNDYLAELSNVSTSHIECTILDMQDSKGEPPIEIILYQGLPKSAKMDLIIQKAVELGVNSIVPIITDRSIVKIKEETKAQKKVDRWQKIAVGAAKQSKRGIIPQIKSIISFDQMLKVIQEGEFVIVPYENENEVGLKKTLKTYKSGKIHVIIGPEGGFEEIEIDKLKEINAHIVTLGPRILRTETAGFTAIAITMYELGDVGVI